MRTGIEDFTYRDGEPMNDTLVFDSWNQWPTVWVSSLIHGNEPYWAKVLEHFRESVRNNIFLIKQWRVLAIMKWNTLAENKLDPVTGEMWVRFVEDDLNRVVANVPEGEVRDNEEQRRWKAIKRLVDETQPWQWFDMHSFSAPYWVPYAFSGLEWYYEWWKDLGIQYMAVNMANANRVSSDWRKEWLWMSDYVNASGWHGYTFEAWNHKDPACYINSYQALINFLVSLDMIVPYEISWTPNNTIIMPAKDIIKIWWSESSHVHIEEKHIFTGWFEYEWGHPQSFRKYNRWEHIWYDIHPDGRKEVVVAEYEGYIIMPKDPDICVIGKEVFYYGKDMSEIAA